MRWMAWRAPNIWQGLPPGGLRAVLGPEAGAGGGGGAGDEGFAERAAVRQRHCGVSGGGGVSSGGGGHGG